MKPLAPRVLKICGFILSQVFVFVSVLHIMCLYVNKASLSPSRIHDRKISVLGFCSLLQSPLRPAPIRNLAPKVIPAIITQLEGLIDGYRRKYICLLPCTVDPCLSDCNGTRPLDNPSSRIVEAYNVWFQLFHVHMHIQTYTHIHMPLIHVTHAHATCLAHIHPHTQTHAHATCMDTQTNKQTNTCTYIQSWQQRTATKKMGKREEWMTMKVGI